MIVSSCSTTTTVLPRDCNSAEGVDQPLVVAGMQPDRRLVEHVADADQSRAQPGRQPHALQLAAAQGAGGPIQREIVQADAVQKIQPRGDFARIGWAIGR